MDENTTAETIAAIFIELKSAGVIKRGDVEDALTRRSISRGLDGVSQAPVAEGEILPCPFCGHEAYTREIKRDATMFLSIYCENADCVQPETGGHPEDISIQLWNTRTPAPAKEPAASPDVAALVVGPRRAVDTLKAFEALSGSTAAEPAWHPGIECEHGYDACPICDKTNEPMDTATEVVRAAVEESAAEDRVLATEGTTHVQFEAAKEACRRAKKLRRVAVRKHIEGK